MFSPFLCLLPHHSKEHRGVLLGSVDNLPAELPKEASIHFGSLLINHVKQLVCGEYVCVFFVFCYLYQPYSFSYLSL